MKVYFSLFYIRVINGLQYRTVVIGAILTRFVWGMMEILAFNALYRTDGTAFVQTFSETVSYIWMQQALYVLFQVVYSDREIVASINDGSVAYELVRPIKLYNNWFAQCMANRISPTLLNCMPVLIIAALVQPKYRIHFPPSVNLVLFLISAILALALVVALALIMHISMFYTTSPRGIRIIVTAVTTFFSGGIIPLPYFPEHVLAIVELLPFASMQSTPLLIYSGSLTSGEVVQSIGIQCVWLLVLIVIGRVLMKRTLSRVVVQGG